MDEDLIGVFGEIVRTSRDTSLDVLSNYKNKMELPKNPDDEQKAFMELVNGLDNDQLQSLEKSIKYCIELSLFKLINTIESGVSNYGFELSITNGEDNVRLVADDIDNELCLEYWNWMG